MQIQIQKPTDLDLHCLQRQGISGLSGFSRTRVNTARYLHYQSNVSWELIHTWDGACFHSITGDPRINAQAEYQIYRTFFKFVPLSFCYMNANISKTTECALHKIGIIMIILILCRVLLHFLLFCSECSGPSCSKLTTSLVNESLKFTSSDTQICWNVLLKKCE